MELYLLTSCEVENIYVLEIQHCMKASMIYLLVRWCAKLNATNEEGYDTFAAPKARCYQELREKSMDVRVSIMVRGYCLWGFSIGHVTCLTPRL